jgi:nitrite reductase/ring-hydroxylating ferredoxin subunit
MIDLIPKQMHPLCRVEDIDDSGAKGFPSGNYRIPGLIAVRHGNHVVVFENACPHIGTPLDWVQGRFFSADGQHLVCATHGALFTPGTGECTAGPCRGDFLTQVPSEVQDGTVMIGRQYDPPAG